MFAGHFGLAAGVKAKTQLPLWAIMLATQLLDVLFVPLLLFGIETLEPVGNGSYGGDHHSRQLHAFPYRCASHLTRFRIICLPSLGPQGRIYFWFCSIQSLAS